jgi:ABC-2 type transport system ATP-binding protein
MDPLIETRNLRKTFDSIPAVKNLSIQVGKGEIYGLVGPDGAGKTTTIRLLCGVITPDHGDIWIAGHSMISNPDKAREQIGYLSQRYSLYEELTVLENIRFFAEVRGIPTTQWHSRAMKILEFVGLDEFSNRRSGILSGGMKQKLGLASALVHNPRVLLLDEPTGGVDPITRQDFWQLIIRLVTEEDVSVVVSTPYMDEAVRCTKVGFMQNGNLVVEDNPQVLRQRFNRRILELRGEPLNILRSMVLADEDVESVQAFGDKLHIRIREGKSQEIIPRIYRLDKSENVLINKIEVVRPSLEDVFIALLEE